MNKGFAVVFLVVVASTSESSKLPRSSRSVTQIGDTFAYVDRTVVTTPGGNYTSKETYFTNGSYAIHIVHTQTYFDGNVTFSDGQTSNSTDFIDTSMDYYAYKAFIIDALHNATLTYNLTDKQHVGVLQNYEVIISGINDTSCPASFALNTPAVPAPDTYIFSDYYMKTGRAYPKNCTWILQAPPQGSLLVINILGNIILHGSETLQISGSLNGTAWQLGYMEGQLPFVCDMVKHSDGAVTIEYKRPDPVYVDMPAFRMLANQVEIVPKNCSLAYDGKTFTTVIGRFTNMIYGKTYPRNEKCKWFVSVPEGALHVYIHKYSTGFESGDKLIIENLQTGEKLEVSSWYGVWYFSCERLPSSNSCMISFEWETDEIREYFGFDIEYRIEEFALDTTTTTSIAVSTAASPETTVTTKTPATTTSPSPASSATVPETTSDPMTAVTTSSSPDHFSNSHTILMIALLASAVQYRTAF